MKTKSLLILSLTLVLILSACGRATEPTLSTNDIADTAVADAWLMVTLTQASLPTATATATVTSLPPTSTLAPLPTVQLLPTAVPATLPPSGAADPCNQPPPYEPKGTLVQVQFNNKSRGSVSLAFGMLQANSLGECGTYNFSIGRFDSPTVEVLAGCYWAYGWVSGDTTSTTKNINALCVPDKSQIWKIEIGPEVVEFQ